MSGKYCNYLAHIKLPLAHGRDPLDDVSRNLGHQQAVNTRMMTSSILMICFRLLLILLVLLTVLVLCCTTKILWPVVLLLECCSFSPCVNDADGVSLSKYYQHGIRITERFLKSYRFDFPVICWERDERTS